MRRWRLTRPWPFTNGRDGRVAGGWRAGLLIGSGPWLGLAAAVGITLAYWARLAGPDESANELAPSDGYGDSTTAIAFSPNGAQLATATLGGTVSVEDRATHDAQLFSRGEHPGLNALAFSPDGRWLAGSGRKGPLCLWYVPTRKECPPLRLGGQERAVRMVFSADGAWLVVLGASCSSIRLIHRRTGEAHAPWEGIGCVVSSAAFSPDSRTFYAGGDDGMVRTWDAASARVSDSFRAHRRAVSRLGISADGAVVASVGYGDHRVSLWDARSFASLGAVGEVGAVVTCLALAPMGDLMAVGWIDGTAGVWNIRTRRKLRRLRERQTDSHRFAALAFAFSPDGRTLVTSGLGVHEPVRYWDVGDADDSAAATSNVSRGDEDYRK
jgi:WD40 repeat protein